MGEVVPFVLATARGGGRPGASAEASATWNEAERAELRRLAQALAEASAGEGRRSPVEVESGVSDAGDPWFVVAAPRTGDVLVHVARIDGVFVVHRVADDLVQEGHDLRALLRKSFRQPDSDPAILSLPASTLALLLLADVLVGWEARAAEGVGGGAGGIAADPASGGAAASTKALAAVHDSARSRGEAFDAADEVVASDGPRAEHRPGEGTDLIPAWAGGVERGVAPDIAPPMQGAAEAPLVAGTTGGGTGATGSLGTNPPSGAAGARGGRGTSPDGAVPSSTGGADGGARTGVAVPPEAATARQASGGVGPEAKSSLPNTDPSRDEGAGLPTRGAALTGGVGDDLLPSNGGISDLLGDEESRSGTAAPSSVAGLAPAPEASEAEWAAPAPGGPASASALAGTSAPAAHTPPMAPLLHPSGVGAHDHLVVHATGPVAPSRASFVADPATGASTPPAPAPETSVAPTASSPPEAVAGEAASPEPVEAAASVGSGARRAHDPSAGRAEPLDGSALAPTGPESVAPGPGEAAAAPPPAHGSTAARAEATALAPTTAPASEVAPPREGVRDADADEPEGASSSSSDDLADADPTASRAAPDAATGRRHADADAGVESGPATTADGAGEERTASSPVEAVWWDRTATVLADDTADASAAARRADALAPPPPPDGALLVHAAVPASAEWLLLA